MDSPRDDRQARPTPGDDRFETIVNSISDGVFAVDLGWRITCFNSAAERTTGIPRSRAIGRRCSEVFRSNICADACALRSTLETGRPVVNLPVVIRNARGGEVPVTVSTALLRNRDGEVVGGVETFRDLDLVRRMLEQVDAQRGVDRVVTRSPALLQILDVVPTIAESESTVLIVGESGTGKGLLASLLHRRSQRRDGPLVTINCGALPEQLLESELFGYRAGAFTGASRDKPGRVAAAAGGTLFLDEIGDLPPSTQVKLLRLLQDRAYEPLGDIRTVDADVRIVTATNRDLAALVAEGRFREDLYYRINVIRLEMPPLRSHLDDLPLLAEAFLRRLSIARGRPVKGVSREALELLAGYEFPGNVRELENILEHAYVLGSGPEIGVHDLPRWLLDRLAGPALPHPTRLAELEARLLREVLERNRWNRTASARELGIHKTTLHRKIRRLGLELPPLDGRSRPAGD